MLCGSCCCHGFCTWPHSSYFVTLPELRRLIWNAGLVLLQPNKRGFVKRAFNSAAKALEVRVCFSAQLHGLDSVRVGLYACLCMCVRTRACAHTLSQLHPCPPPACISHGTNSRLCRCIRLG